MINNMLNIFYYESVKTVILLHCCDIFPYISILFGKSVWEGGLTNNKAL